MSIKVVADENGDFTLNISTEGVPTGEFLVTAGGIEKTIRIVPLDTTPPASITNLQNITYEQAYIYWTWNDPVDEDFSHVMVYLNGSFKENVSRGVQCYNATGLAPDTEYTVGTRTVDTSKNINETGVNHTAKTAPPHDTTPPLFGTGSGTYPSISGTHNGTITPNQTITVSKLYTYPCIGTGGHSEYVRIGNKTWNVTANWTGYTGDWHNITFSTPFIISANKTYNYTIMTGSYPLIIHQHEANVTGGAITCTEFVDANGKIYKDYIPAIILS